MLIILPVAFQLSGMDSGTLTVTIFSVVGAERAKNSRVQNAFMPGRLVCTVTSASTRTPGSTAGKFITLTRADE